MLILTERSYLGDGPLGLLLAIGRHLKLILARPFWSVGCPSFPGTATRSVASVPATGEPHPSLQSLIHSGLRQAASAFKKTLNLEGRNFRFEYTAKTGISADDHFGKRRTSAPLAIAAS